MPTVSRSSIEFQRRNGMTPTPRSPRPILNAVGAKIHKVPLKREQLDGNEMLMADGRPPTDRGVTDEWPPKQEVTIGEDE